MENQPDNDLRRLAKRYGIIFKPPLSAEEWPAAHRCTFGDIRKIGSQSFDTFCASIGIRSSEEPWREQTKLRAEWLTERASRLFTQERNEAGWRFGLENDVFRRFSFEVACPTCRARIWRSEIEASIYEPDDNIARQLEERRKSRTACECPPDTRPQDM
ncbi:uncharacterized protein K441DRAFT_680777 [Cenococcum geophilum 1.58]|uniref:uncharacterized protein n=1 Tax=Cenococcum geophilum 1.58 TaxID=794803 RepID=UPI00358FF917|nr:hypothetical protein K441DRAFT_680777 [Cenococcum geophilum 1.58]